MRRLRLAVAMLAGTLALSACDFDIYSLPLPGGADLGDDPVTVQVEFDDVLDLVPQSAVKVNDISVGQVTDIELQEGNALVTLELRGDTDLPQNAIATIRQTSLLGEKFVSLDPPTAEDPVGVLADDDEIPLDRTGANPDVEEVLGALSLLLNGGGLPQLRTIAQEVNLALEGREESARSVLQQVDVFMSQLDTNKATIVEAIESLNRLGQGVRAQQDSIDQALDELPSALDSLDRQRDDLIVMLQSLNRLGDVGVRVINRSKDSTEAVLRQLQPTLTQLANAGDSLVDSFSVILTYPFVDEVVGRDPQVARSVLFGDYVNLSARVEIDVANLPVPGIPCFPLEAIDNALPLEDILDLGNLCQDAQDALGKCLDEPSLANCSAIPRDLIQTVCDSVGLPIPLLCDNGGRGGRGGRGGQLLPDLLPDLGGALGGLGGLGGGGLGGLGGRGGPGGRGGLDGRGGLGGLGDLGDGLRDLLNRPGTSTQPSGARAPRVDGRGLTYGELMEMFDPGLTMLLTPGVVLR